MSLCKVGFTALAYVSIFFVGTATAATIEVLPMGDSITVGVGTDTSGVPTQGEGDTTDNDVGGYRFFVDRRFGSNVEFVGNSSRGSGFTGSGFTDNEHFGVSGASASLDESGMPSMLTGIDNAGPNATGSDAAFDTNATNPDSILLHIGINDIGKSLPPRQGNESQEDRADRALEMAVDRFETLLDGDTSTSRTGLVSRLADTNFFASDAHLFGAFITPRTDSTGTVMRRRQPSLVAEFNSLVKGLIEEDRSGSGDALENRVTFVDLFSIRIDDLNLGALANEFYGGDQAQLLAAISPEDDTLDGEGVDYVDWVDSVTAFDEGNYEGGTFLQETRIFGGTGENTNYNLMEDGLHPSNLGAAIMAQVWSDALLQQYPAIPEPGATALILAGGGLLLFRRCRHA